MNYEYSTNFTMNVAQNELWIQHKMNDEYSTKFMMNIAQNV